MAIFGGPKKRLRDLEASILVSKSLYDMHDKLPPQMKERVEANFGEELRSNYQAAVAAGASTEADALITRYRGQIPESEPKSLPRWGELLDSTSR